MFHNFIVLLSVFDVLGIQFIRYPFHSHFDFRYLRIKEFFSITAKFSGTPFFCKESNTPLRLFDGLLISTEKLVSELLSRIMRALRILLYRILFFRYSVLI